MKERKKPQDLLTAPPVRNNLSGSIYQRLTMIVSLHFTLFFPGICYCADCRIRFKVTEVQTDVQTLLYSLQVIPFYLTRKWK